MNGGINKVNKCALENQTYYQSLKMNHMIFKCFAT